jgi:DNA-binding NarL/FixJ family response regulator
MSQRGQTRAVSYRMLVAMARDGSAVPLRVLIADDDLDIRSLVSFVLCRDPAIVLVGEAGDGEAAVGLVRQQQPDVVVMDVRMPGGGGLHATRRIKREWPGIKVLVMTSLADEDTRDAAFVNGADSFLNKRDITTTLLPAIWDATRARVRPEGSAARARQPRSNLSHPFLGPPNLPL